jgi:hypothetical protein
MKSITDNFRGPKSIPSKLLGPGQTVVPPLRRKYAGYRYHTR